MTQMFEPTEHEGWSIGTFLDRIEVVKVGQGYFRLGHPVRLRVSTPGLKCSTNTRGIIMKVRAPGKKNPNHTKPKGWDKVLKVWFEGTYYPVWVSPYNVTSVEVSS